MKKIGVLYSGGLDSAALVGHLAKKGNDVSPVYIQCGLPWEKAEIYWAKKFLRSFNSKRVKKIHIAHLLLEGAYKKNWSHTGKIPGADSADWDMFLPARNLLLITKALLALSSHGIYMLAIATLKGNPFPDATPEFFYSVQKLLSKSFRKPVKIIFPFQNKSKREVLKQNKSIPLHLSFSCINPQSYLHCGICNKCAERRTAFTQAGLPDKTGYKSF